MKTKKLCAIALTHLLCDSEAMIIGIYFNQLWLILLQNLLQLFESTNQLELIFHTERKKQIEDETDDELTVGLDDTPG